MSVHLHWLPPIHSARDSSVLVDANCSVASSFVFVTSHLQECLQIQWGYYEAEEEDMQSLHVK